MKEPDLPIHVGKTRSKTFLFLQFSTVGISGKNDSFIIRVFLFGMYTGMLENIVDNYELRFVFIVIITGNPLRVNAVFTVYFQTYH